MQLVMCQKCHLVTEVSDKAASRITALWGDNRWRYRSSLHLIREIMTCCSRPDPRWVWVRKHIYTTDVSEFSCKLSEEKQHGKDSQ